MRAAVYLRQSEDRTGTGLAVARQREDCLKLCEQRGWEPVEYLDNDTSASTGVRPSYQRMLEDAESGAVGAVVAWDLDRLHRRPVELEHFMDLADRRSLLLATVTGEVDLSTDNGRLFARIKGAVARAEVERKSARQRRAARQSAEAGKMWGGPRAFGYTTSGDLIDSEAALIADAYQRVLRGDSLRSIAMDWNKVTKTPRGNLWKGSTTRQNLLNSRNAGLRTYKGEVVGEGDWEPIVTEDVYWAVCSILNDPARLLPQYGARKYLLSGILRCGRCDHKMGSGVRRSDHLYMCKNCYRNTRLGKPVDDLVEALVVAFLGQPQARELLVDDSREDIGALRDAEAAILGRMDQLAVDYAEGLLTGRDVKVARDKFDAQLSSVRSRMADVNSVAVLGDVIGEGAEARWAGLGLDRRRAIIQRLMTPVLLPAGRGRAFKPEQLSVRWLTDQ